MQMAAGRIGIMNLLIALVKYPIHNALRKEITMKWISILLLLIIPAIPCFSEEISSGKTSPQKWQDKMETMKIKTRAARGCSQNGRVIYEYVGDRDIRNPAPHQIGAIRLDDNSRAREVYVGIDIDKKLYFNNDDSDNSLNIGTVDASGDSASRLRKVYINVDMEKRIDF
jgi:leucyl-tRNA synthetase